MPVTRTNVTMSTSNPRLQRLFQDAEDAARQNVRKWGLQGDVLVEGDIWTNVWLETQPMGGEMYAKRDLGIALNNISLFFDFQLRNGQLPAMVLEGFKAWYGSLGFLSLTWPALNVYYLLGKDKVYAQRLYEALAGYDEFLWTYRDSDGDGCLETWAEFDTGEDDTLRLQRAPQQWHPTVPPQDGDLDVPYESMNVMADSYGARRVLAELARELDNGEESLWLAKAEDVRRKVIDYLWLPDKFACYDRDKNNEIVDCLHHNNLRCMYQGLFTQTMADDFINYHLLNPDEFWTPMPLASIARNDRFFSNENHAYCHWSGPSGGLTYQRAIRALENYGHYAEVTLIGRKLLARLSEHPGFPVQWVTDTGEARGDSGNYGPTILSALEYISRMYGIHIERERIYWSSLDDAQNSTYSQAWNGNEYRLEQRDGVCAGYANGELLFECSAGTRIVTGLNGGVLQVCGIDSVSRDIFVRHGDGDPVTFAVGPNEVFELNREGGFTKTASAPFDYPYGGADA